MHGRGKSAAHFWEMVGLGRVPKIAFLNEVMRIKCICAFPWTVQQASGSADRDGDEGQISPDRDGGRDTFAAHTVPVLEIQYSEPILLSSTCISASGLLAKSFRKCNHSDWTTYT